MFDVDISKGYVDMPVPEGIDLVSEIERMKREKNAVVLAHYYQSGDLQDIADFVGDSLALAQWASRTKADILVLCGVQIMWEILWLWLNGLRKQMLPYWCFAVFILWVRPPKLFVPTRKY